MILRRVGGRRRSDSDRSMLFSASLSRAGVEMYDSAACNSDGNVKGILVVSTRKSWY